MVGAERVPVVFEQHHAAGRGLRAGCGQDGQLDLAVAQGIECTRRVIARHEVGREVDAVGLLQASEAGQQVHAAARRGDSEAPRSRRRLEHGLAEPGHRHGARSAAHPASKPAVPTTASRAPTLSTGDIV